MPNEQRHRLRAVLIDVLFVMCCPHVTLYIVKKIKRLADRVQTTQIYQIKAFAGIVRI